MFPDNVYKQQPQMNRPSKKGTQHCNLSLESAPYKPEPQKKEVKKDVFRFNEGRGFGIQTKPKQSPHDLDFSFQSCDQP